MRRSVVAEGGEVVDEPEPRDWASRLLARLTRTAGTRLRWARPLAEAASLRMALRSLPPAPGSPATGSPATGSPATGPGPPSPAQPVIVVSGADPALGALVVLLGGTAHLRVVTEAGRAPSGPVRALDRLARRFGPRVVVACPDAGVAARLGSAGAGPVIVAAELGPGGHGAAAALDRLIEIGRGLVPTPGGAPPA